MLLAFPHLHQITTLTTERERNLLNRTRITYVTGWNRVLQMNKFNLLTHLWQKLAASPTDKRDLCWYSDFVAFQAAALCQRSGGCSTLRLSYRVNAEGKNNNNKKDWWDYCYRLTKSTAYSKHTLARLWVCKVLLGKKKQNTHTNKKTGTTSISDKRTPWKKPVLLFLLWKPHQKVQQKHPPPPKKKNCTWVQWSTNSEHNYQLINQYCNPLTLTTFLSKKTQQNTFDFRKKERKASNQRRLNQGNYNHCMTVSVKQSEKKKGLQTNTTA